MSWVESFFGAVNRKCGNCGKLLSDGPARTLTDDGERVELCSEWCAEYYREHKL